MKRRLIIVAIVMVLVGISGIVWKTGVFDTQKRRTSAPVGQTFTVVASDAPGWMRVDGPGRYLCNGTAAAGGDEVQIQAAVDAADAIGWGAKVNASPGTFYITKPTGAVDVVFTADIADGTGSATLVDDSVSLNVTTGTFANIAVGQIYRASSGQDDGDNSVEDNAVDICFTIERKSVAGGTTGVTYDGTDTLSKASSGIGTGVDAGDYVYVYAGTGATPGWYEVASVTDADTIVLTTDAGNADTDWELAEAFLSGEDFVEDYGSIAGGSGAQPTFSRIIGAIQLKQGVYLEGAGLGGVSGSTVLYLADGSNCTMVTCEPAAASQIGTGMSNISLNGNRTNQGDGSDYTFHPLCNGIILNDNIWDAHFQQVSVIGMKGDGWHINQPWGSEIYGGGWTEFCNGYGIVYGDGNNGTLVTHKIAALGEGTGRDADSSNTCPGDGGTFGQGGIKLYYVNYCLISPSICSTDRGWALWIRGNGTRIANVDFLVDDSNASGGIYIGFGGGMMTVSGCTFSVTASGSVGLRLEAVPSFTVIGNTFATTCPTPIDIISGGVTSYGTITGNVNCFVGGSGASVAISRTEMRSEELKNTRGSAIAARTFCKRNTSSGTITIADGTTTAISPLGMVVDEIANSASGAVQICGYQPKGPIDNSADYGNIAVGTELCCTDATDGALEAAAQNDWVIAIMEEAYDPPGGGGTTRQYKAIYILPPEERYIKP